jgi:hypothetical protein
VHDQATIPAASAPATRFFQCLQADRRPRPWTPPVPVEDVVDTWYFGRAFAAMDRELRLRGLTVYVTNDLERLPSYGDDVVALIIGDDFARVPAYISRVRAVFRTQSARPHLGCNPLAWPSLATFASLIPAGRAAIKCAPGHVRRLGAELAASRGRGRRPAPMIDVPIGTYNALDLPLTPFAERRTDVFFAGSVEHRPGRRAAALKRRVMPKDLSRTAMLRNAERLGRHPELAVDIRLTGSFVQSISSDPGEYSRAMMDTRVALVPRGTTAETQRFFAALKYGCVVVTDAIAPSWFYARAPVVRLRHWDELEHVVVPLLAQPERLEGLHRQALAWWEQACSEEAVGRLMAAALNALA